jgi:hypothetical protein
MKAPAAGPAVTGQTAAKNMIGPLSNPDHAQIERGQSQKTENRSDTNGPFRLKVVADRPVIPNPFEHQVRKAFEALSAERKTLVEREFGSIDTIVACHGIDIQDSEERIRLVIATRIQDKNMQRVYFDLKYRENSGGINFFDYVSSPDEEDWFYEVRAKSTPKASQNIATEERAATTSTRAPSRVDRVQLAAWVDPQYKSRLLQLKAQDLSRSTESLVEEALNLLFDKYDVPGVPVAPRRARGPKRSPG